MSKSQIFVFGQPASASSLLKRMLEKHPRLDIFDNPFQEAYNLGPERLQRRDDGDIRHSDDGKETNRLETYQKAFDRLQQSMKRAEQEGRRTVIIEDTNVIFRPDITSAHLEHGPSRATVPTPVIMTSKTMPNNYRCPLRASKAPRSSDSALFTATFPIFHPITEGLGIHTIESRSPNANPTVLPDAFLKSMTPICLIQHPARSIPSLHRSAAHLNLHGPEFRVQASLHWCRLLVDWYAVVTGTKPVVLDRDCLYHEPAAITQLGGLLLVDKSWLRESRDASLSRGGIGGSDDAATSAVGDDGSMRRSNGEERDGLKRDDEIDVDEEAEAWKKEFGGDVAGTLKRFVVDAMDDYSYLRQYATN